MSNSETSGTESQVTGTSSQPESGYSPQPRRQSPASFGTGFIFGLIFSILLAAYPLYVAFFSTQTQEKVVNQAILDTMQIQITLAHKELESVNRQLEMIAEAEARYQALVHQRFDLETSRSHLQERIENLEKNLAAAEQKLGVEANKFERITEAMRLN